MKKMKVSFVIPLYNEQPSLKELVSSTEKMVSSRAWDVEYVFVDDGSTDGSFDTLKKLKAKSKHQMTLIRFRKNSGKSMALAEAFRAVTGDVIVTLDADLQDDPMEVPKLMHKLDQGYDLVVGWRKERQDMQGKLRLSHIFNSVVSYVAKVPLHDMNCGMKVMRKAVTEEIDVYGELHRFIPVLAKAQGFKVTEVAIVHHARKYGVSKFGPERIMRAPFDLMTTVFLTTFRTRPLQIFGPIGISFIGVGGISLLYLTVLHFMGQSIGRRPLLLFGILVILFGVQLLSTGLVGELVTKTNIRKERRPVEEILI
jgi:glycosyltransferase involved in cell wall biosynthesis